MNSTARSIAAVVSFAILLVIAFGLVIVVQKSLGLFGELNNALLAILVVVLIATAILASGFRATAKAQEQRLRMESKLAEYCAVLARVSQKNPIADVDPMQRNYTLLLVGSAGVLKAFERLIRADAESQSSALAFASLVREMRRDIGQTNLNLKDEEILAIAQQEIDSSG